MTAAELVKELHISRRTLAKWLAKGLPHKRTKRGRQYDPDQVMVWLVAQGIVAKPAQVVATIAGAAKELGISERAFHTWLAAGCPARVQGGYDIGVAQQWNTDRRRQPDPLLMGPSSPALEAYRRRRAELARLEVLERKHVLIDRRQIEPTMQRFSQIMRTAVETLQREFGTDAAKIIDDALLDSLRVVDSLAQQNGDSNPNSETE